MVLTYDALETDLKAKIPFVPSNLTQLRLMVHKSLLWIGDNLSQLESLSIHTSPAMTLRLLSTMQLNWASYHQRLLRYVKVELEDGAYLIRKHVHPACLTKRTNAARAEQPFGPGHMAVLLGPQPKEQRIMRAQVQVEFETGARRPYLPSIMASAV
eukprot:scaffold77949_cov50-Prasinocladus_malaysianus.AAC.1